MKNLKILFLIVTLPFSSYSQTEGIQNSTPKHWKISVGGYFGFQWMNNPPKFMNRSQPLYFHSHSLFGEITFHKKFSLQLGFKQNTINQDASVNKDKDQNKFSPLRMNSIDYSIRYKVVIDKESESSIYPILGSSNQWVNTIFNKTNYSEVSFQRIKNFLYGFGIEDKIEEKILFRIELLFFNSNFNYQQSNDNISILKSDYWSGGQVNFQLIFDL
jgi:hypothetical protein